MKLIYREVKESLLQNKFFTFLLIIQIVAFLLLLSTLFLNFIKVDAKMSSFYAQFKGKNVYQLSDTLIDQKEQIYFQGDSHLHKIKAFYNGLNQNRQFLYLNSTRQPIEIIGFRGTKKFMYGYEESPMENLSGVKAMQVNKNTMELTGVEVEEGGLLKTSDFVYKEESIVPVLLGSQYKGIYNIGDTFEINYILKKINVRVIGILKPNSIIPVQNQTDFYVDRYIVMPELIFNSDPQNDEEMKFQKRHYLHLINGMIVTKKDSLQTKDFVYDISRTSDFYDIFIIGADNMGTEFLFGMIKQNRSLIFSITVVLFIFSVLSMSFSFIMKINRNTRKFAVHLISGASIHNITFYMLYEILFIFVCSVTIVSVFLFLIVGLLPWYYYLMILVASLISSLLVMVPVFYKVKKTKIIGLLKRKD